MGEAGIHFLLEAVENADVQYQQQKQFFMASMQAMVRTLGLPGPLSPLPVLTRGRKRARGQAAAAGKENLGLGLANCPVSQQKKAARTGRCEKVVEGVENEALDAEIEVLGERLHGKGGEGFEALVSLGGGFELHARANPARSSARKKPDKTPRSEKGGENDVALEVCESAGREGGEDRNHKPQPEATPPKVFEASLEPGNSVHGENEVQTRVSPALAPCSEQTLDQWNREPQVDERPAEVENEKGEATRVQFLEPSLIEQEFQFFVDPGLTVDEEVKEPADEQQNDAEQLEELVDEPEDEQARGLVVEQNDAGELQTSAQVPEPVDEHVEVPEEAAQETHAAEEKLVAAFCFEEPEVESPPSPGEALVDEQNEDEEQERELEEDEQEVEEEDEEKRKLECPAQEATAEFVEFQAGEPVPEELNESEIIPEREAEEYHENCKPTGQVAEQEAVEDSEEDRDFVQKIADEVVAAERFDEELLVEDSADEQEFATNGQRVDARVSSSDMELGTCSPGKRRASHSRGSSAAVPGRRRTEAELEAPPSNEIENEAGTGTELLEKEKSSEPVTKSFNLVSNMRSFLPLVLPQQPALAIANGKKEVRVKALEAAEAARKLEEKRAEERKARKLELLKQAGSQHPGVSTRSKRPQEGKTKLIEEEQKKRDEEFRKRKAMEEAEREAKRQKRMEKEKEIERRRKADEEAKANWLASKEADRKRREETFQRLKVLEKEQKRHADKRPVAEIIQNLASQSQAGVAGEVQREKSLGLLGHAMRIRKDSSSQQQQQLQQQQQQQQRKAVSLSMLRSSFNAKQSLSLSGAELYPGTPVVKSLDLQKQLYSTPFAGEVDEEDEEEEEEGPVSYEISPYKNSDDEEDEEDEEDEKRRLQKPIPCWARKENLMPQLVRQAYVDPDKIFSSANGCSLNEVFGTTGNRKRKDFAERGRSGDWLSDMVTWKEELLYKKSMGYL